MRASEQAIELYKQSIVWDQSIIWSGTVRETGLLDKLRDWGVTAASAKINPKPDVNADDLKAILSDLIAERVEMKSDAGLTPVFSKADVKKAKADGKLGITFSLADSSFIENPQRDFELYSLLGVTHCVLSAMHNYCGESCYDRDSGLSPYGKYMVTLFNSSPLYLDGSLGGYKTTMEAMEISQKPFIFSHVNPYGVCRNSRNIRDDQITACAKTGGVIGITFIGGYLGSETPDSELVFRNIDYICQLVGSEHVGIGSNYMSDTTAFWSVIKNYQSTDEISSGGCFDYSKLPEVVDLMLTHGYSEQDVRNILGLNWFSLFAD